jgi:arylsulfatase A-like enzyme
VLAKLREHKLEENTLIFFASDNGGPLNAHVSNGPYAGGKWSLWEGGIRSPIFIQWKGRIPAGRELPHMINQLDFLPTALAAAGVGAKPEWQLDGVNLLPWLEGKTDKAPHDALYWRFGVQYAVRQGDWKLVKPELKQAPKLFNLAADPGEKTDLAAKMPDKVKQLQALWDAWNAKNEPPRWIDERWNGLEEKKGKKDDL